MLWGSLTDQTAQEILLRRILERFAHSITMVCFEAAQLTPTNTRVRNLVVSLHNEVEKTGEMLRSKQQLWGSAPEGPIASLLMKTQCQALDRINSELLPMLEAARNERVPQSVEREVFKVLAGLETVARDCRQAAGSRPVLSRLKLALLISMQPVRMLAASIAVVATIVFLTIGPHMPDSKAKIRTKIRELEYSANVLKYTDEWTQPSAEPYFRANVVQALDELAFLVGPDTETKGPRAIPLSSLLARLKYELMTSTNREMLSKAIIEVTTELSKFEK